MSLDANKQLVRRFFKAVEERDGAALEALLAEDGAYWIIGAGERSKSEFIADIGMLWQIVDGPVTVDIHSMTAEEERVSAIGSGQMTLADGRPYRNSYHILATVDGSRISGWREYFDTQLISTLFAPPAGGLGG